MFLFKVYVNELQYITCHQANLSPSPWLQKIMISSVIHTIPQQKKKSFHLIFLGQKYVYMSCFGCSPNSMYVTQLKNMSCAFGIFALQAESPEARC